MVTNRKFYIKISGWKESSTKKFIVNMFCVIIFLQTYANLPNSIFVCGKNSTFKKTALHIFVIAYPLKAQGVWTKYKCNIKYKFYNFFEVSIKENNVKHKK